MRRPWARGRRGPGGRVARPRRSRSTSARGGGAPAGSASHVTWRARPAIPPVLAADLEPPGRACSTGATSAPSAGPRVAIVGTRRCTATGAASPASWAATWPRPGVAVVSGLAAGIDGAAHRGALAADGRAARSASSAAGSTSSTRRGQHELWRAVAAAGRAAVRGAARDAGPSAGGSRPATASSPRSPTSSSWSSRTARGGSLHTVDEADRRRHRRDGRPRVRAQPGGRRAPTRCWPRAGRRPLGRRRARGPRPRDRSVAGGRPTRRPAPDARRPRGARRLGWQPATLDQLVLRTGPRLADAGRLRSTDLCETGWVAPARAAGTSGSPGVAARGVPMRRATWSLGTVSGVGWHLDGLRAVAHRRRRRRPSTAYRRDLRAFVDLGRAARASTGPGRVDRRTLRRYLAFLATRGQARRTIARQASALRRYFGWLRRTGRRRPSTRRPGLSAPKGEARLPRVLRPDELRAPARRARPAAVDGDPATRGSTSATTRVLELLYGSGLRVAEATRPRRRRARPRPAAGSSCGARAASSAGAAQRAGRRRPRRWLGRRPAAPWPPRRARRRAVFLNRRGRRLTPRDARRIARPAGGGAHPPPRPAPHLRHPPARRGRRPASRPGAARPCRPGDHAALHSRLQGTAEGSVRRHPPAGLGTRT